MLVIQVLCVALLAGYFSVPGVRFTIEALGALKERSGLPFVLLAGFVSGGLLPELAKATVGRVKRFDTDWLKQWTFTGLVYAVSCIGVVTMYAVQLTLFGETTNLLVLVKKLLFDGLVYVPFFSIPYFVGLLGWRDSGFRSSYWKRFFTWKTVTDDMLPTMLLSWTFWTPVLVCVYSLPTTLQFVLSTCAMAAWSLLLVYMVSPSTEILPEIQA